MSKPPQIEVVRPLAYVAPDDEKTQELVRRALVFFRELAQHVKAAELPEFMEVHVVLRDLRQERQLCAVFAPGVEDAADAISRQVVAFANALGNILVQLPLSEREQMQRWIVNVVTGAAQRARGN